MQSSISSVYRDGSKMGFTSKCTRLTMTQLLKISLGTGKACEVFNSVRYRYNSTINYSFHIACGSLFSSPEPSGSQGELIVYPCSVVRPSVVRPSVVRPSSTIFKDLLL